MESVLNWGIDVVLWFQQFSPALDLPFKVLTSLGDKEFYLLLMPAGILVYQSSGRGQIVFAVADISLPERSRQVADGSTATV